MRGSCGRTFSGSGSSLLKDGPARRQTAPFMATLWDGRRLWPGRLRLGVVSRPRSSAGQSAGLLIRWSQVRILPGAPRNACKCAGVAHRMSRLSGDFCPKPVPACRVSRGESEGWPDAWPGWDIDGVPGRTRRRGRSAAMSSALTVGSLRTPLVRQVPTAARRSPTPRTSGCATSSRSTGATPRRWPTTAR